MSSIFNSRLLLVLVVLGADAAESGQVVEAITFRTVALSGQSAPGVDDGAAFTGFNRPVLNRAGQVAFTGGVDGLNGTTNGIWSEGTGSLTLVARQGLAAPGTDVNFSSVFLDPLISNGGQTAFTGLLSGPGVTISNRGGYWSDASGSLQLVAREDMLAPNAGDGTHFTRVGIGLSTSFGISPGIDNAGRTAFFAVLNGPTVNTTNNETIWSERGGGLHVVVRKGSAAPEMAENIKWQFVGDLVLVNGVGQIAFGASIGSHPETSTVSLWTELDGVFRRVASERSPAPGTPVGTNFASFWDLSINNAGETALVAQLDNGPGLNTTNDSGIWTERAGNLRLVAREGDEAPGVDGATFRQFYTDSARRNALVLNSDGETAFLGEVSGPNVAFSRGIWSEGGGSLHLVAREGLPAPGTDPGTNFRSFHAPVLNGLGHLAFQADLAGPGGNTGIWVEGPNGLELVVRSREQFEVAPGDTRTILRLGFYGGSGNEDGGRSGFNDVGQLVFNAQFTDGTSGVFVADLGVVPEPASATLMLAVVGLLLLSRRRV